MATTLYCFGVSKISNSVGIYIEGYSLGSHPQKRIINNTHHYSLSSFFFFFSCSFGLYQFHLELPLELPPLKFFPCFLIIHFPPNKKTRPLTKKRPGLQLKTTSMNHHYCTLLTASLHSPAPRALIPLTR